ESPDARRAEAGETAREVALRAAKSLEKYLVECHEEIAALIVEPLIQCAAGMAMHDAEYLKQIRLLCDRFDVHLIADEIAVGCGRTGTFFACEQASIWPDFMCLSKGISGGYLPLSLVLTTDSIYQAFYDDSISHGFLHSHSYTGNALACAAALATLELFERDNVIAANQLRAVWMTDAARTISAHPRVRNMRQCGMVVAFEVESQNASFPQRFFRAALDNQILLRPIGQTVYWMPPYILDQSNMAWLGAQTLAALDQTI
ncbi:MAG TPA: aminotransferase class III-fold pyridoxal phosphate-dependent enzyme, partial [Rhodocyclaceae bacterium]|nr:aminotransferase class III-fold pyridoxal phosphate-dependent enzyme [Rhodocyclaceae bacterium]